MLDDVAELVLEGLAGELLGGVLGRLVNVIGLVLLVGAPAGYVLQLLQLVPAAVVFVVGVALVRL